jgi:hypothetical protein
MKSFEMVTESILPDTNAVLTRFEGAFQGYLGDLCTTLGSQTNKASFQGYCKGLYIAPEPSFERSAIMIVHWLWLT